MLWRRTCWKAGRPPSSSASQLAGELHAAGAAPCFKRHMPTPAYTRSHAAAHSARCARSFVPSRILRSAFKRKLGYNVPIQTVGLALYDIDGADPATSPVQRTQWLVYGDGPGQVRLNGQRVLIVDEVRGLQQLHGLLWTCGQCQSGQGAARPHATDAGGAARRGAAYTSRMFAEHGTRACCC